MKLKQRYTSISVSIFKIQIEYIFKILQLQLKRENDLFKEHQAVIKEERKRQNDEISKTIMKQINEIEELKVSIERQSVEARRKRMKV